MVLHRGGGDASNQILGGQIGNKQIPPVGEKLFSSVPTSYSLISVSTLEGLLELTQHPLRALDSPCTLHQELQRYKDTIRCGAEVPEHCQDQLTQMQILHLRQCTCYGCSANWECPGPPCPPPFTTRPHCYYTPLFVLQGCKRHRKAETKHTGLHE